MLENSLGKNEPGRGGHGIESHLAWLGRTLKLIERSWQSLCWFHSKLRGLIDSERDNEVNKVL